MLLTVLPQASATACPEANIFSSRISCEVFSALFGVLFSFPTASRKISKNKSVILSEAFIELISGISSLNSSASSCAVVSPKPSRYEGNSSSSLKFANIRAATFEILV